MLGINRRWMSEIGRETMHKSKIKEDEYDKSDCLRLIFFKTIEKRFRCLLYGNPQEFHSRHTKL